MTPPSRRLHFHFTAKDVQMEQKKRDRLELGAVLQRDGETYAITPRIPCGLITDFSLLRKVADVAERYGAEAIKVTSAQRLALIGVEEEDLERIWDDLGMTPGYALGMCIRGVKACPGTTYCRLGKQDALGLGLRLEERFANMELPNKLKIAVSGCPLDCAEAQVRDIGLLGGRKGYKVLVGGSVGASPRLGEVFVENVEAEAAEELVERLIDAYRELGKKRRLGKVLASVGLEAFKARVQS